MSSPWGVPQSSIPRRYTFISKFLVPSNGREAPCFPRGRFPTLWEGTLISLIVNPRSPFIASPFKEYRPEFEAIVLFR